MDIIYTLINLGVVPLVAVYISSLRRKEELKLSATFLCRYALAVTINEMMAKSIAGAIYYLSDFYIGVDRAAFTGCAFVAAIIQPFLFEAWRRFLAYAIVEKNDNEVKEK